MMRDGFIEEYRKYEITEEQEKIWLIELIEKELNQLDINNKHTLFLLWYILQTNCISSYVNNIIDFIEKKQSKADSEGELLSFIVATSEVIDRIEDSCKSCALFMGSYRERIEIMKCKYLSN